MRKIAIQDLLVPAFLCYLSNVYLFRILAFMDLSSFGVISVIVGIFVILISPVIKIMMGAIH